MNQTMWTKWVCCGVVLAGMLGIRGARAQSAGPCTVVAADKDVVTETIRTMYAAAAVDDLARFHGVAAADFYAFDGGKRFDGDTLMSLIKTYHAAGYTFVWTVNEPNVVLDCTTAVITYVNRGSVKSPQGTEMVTWLESALLEKRASGWVIRFFHSTRVPEEKK